MISSSAPPGATDHRPPPAGDPRRVELVAPDAGELLVEAKLEIERRVPRLGEAVARQPDEAGDMGLVRRLVAREAQVPINAQHAGLGQRERLVGAAPGPARPRGAARASARPRATGSAACWRRTTPSTSPTPARARTAWRRDRSPETHPRSSCPSFYPGPRRALAAGARRPRPPVSRATTRGRRPQKRSPISP